VVGRLETPVGPLPQVEGQLRAADRWGAVRCRFGVGRMRYRVVPGLYALGRPDAQAPVLVTANYKLSFDRLRQAMAGHDVWILVLDTDGVNVWCAAGKGTFGTEELVRQVSSTGLAEVVTHRRLILPQLGAPGVAGHRVRPATGFSVVWGPIRAEDLPAFLAAGLRATQAMRRKAFPLRERAALTPMELVGALEPLAVIAPLVLLLAGLASDHGFWAGVSGRGLTALLAVLAGFLAGGVVTPLLLPWLPGRAFSVKGLVAGLPLAALVVATRVGDLGAWSGRLEAAAWLLLVPAIAAFAAMLFTGASTYTSLSGVRVEMRRAVPLQVAAALLGLALWFGALWGV
jgi:hypothetical protein